MQMKQKLGNKIMGMFTKTNQTTPRIGNYNEVKTANNSLVLDDPIDIAPNQSLEAKDSLR